MSTTHTPATLTVPDGLTPNATAVYTALHTQPGQTPVELAKTTGLGRSTVSKILVTLEDRRIARREPGTSAQHGRQPDSWHLHDTTEAAPESCASPTDDAPNATDADRTTASIASDNRPERNTAPDSEEPGIAELDCTPADSSATRPTQMTEPPAANDGNDRASCGDAPSTEAATAQPSGRLGQGGLRTLVLAYLQSHPGEPVSPTKISRELGRSSGAIANALVTLVNLGDAQMVTSKPRTYRLKQ